MSLAVETADLKASLRRRGVGDVLSDDASRAQYSSDGSLYRLVPQLVVRPRSHEEVEAVLDVARETSVPVVARGAGTSVAGNAIGTGIMVDFSRHMNRVLVLDPEALTATVEPGVVHARLAGCCGLAGNFGVERGHYEVSVAVASQHLLPAANAAPNAILLH